VVAGHRGAAITPRPAPHARRPDRSNPIRATSADRSSFRLHASLAAYDHAGDSFTYRRRIVRLDDRTFHEDGRTDLKAEILAVADGEGAMGRDTQPETNERAPDAFLKRIGADGAVSSKLLPFGSDPVGDVAVGAGAVWVPLRDGVLRYDAGRRSSCPRLLAPAQTGAPSRS
jgi:hypothetical protein